MSTRYEALVARLDGADFYSHVMELARAGADALPAVQAAMSHSNWRIRRGCAAVLGYVDDIESLRRLVLLTRDPKKKVRKMAVLSLGLGSRLRNDGRHAIDVVPHLAHSALHDPSARVRRVAVGMLLLQPPARRVTRILRKVLATEKDAKAVRVAGWGLRQQERRARPAGDDGAA